MLVAVVERELVLDASARLDDGSHALVAGNLHAVGEREEGIARHDGAVQVETEVLCLLYRLLQGIHAAGLAHAACQQLLTLGKDDGVGLAVLHNLVGEEHILHFLRRGGFGGDGLQLFGSLNLEVTVLHQHAVQQGAELLLGQGSLLADKDDAVLLLTEDFQRVHIVVGSDNHFKEYLVDFLGSSLVDHRVGDEHASESRYGVAGKRVVPRFEHGGAGSQTAGIVVLQHGEGGFREFVNQVYGSIDVEQVVVGDFLAVDLVEHGIEVAVEVTLLVRVLAVAQGLLVVCRLAESSALLTVEVIEDSRVVVGRDGKRLFGKPAALFQRSGGAMLHQHVAERLVLCLRSHDNHVVVVLGSGTNQRDAAYVNLLDDCRFVGTACHGRFKRVEVDDDKVYFGNFIFLNLLHILLQSAAAKDTSENLRMQRLHTAAQDRRIGRKVFHRLAGIA